MKKCNCCGKVYDNLPVHASLNLDALPPGWYFNCTCNSTLVIPVDKEVFERIERRLLGGSKRTK